MMHEIKMKIIQQDRSNDTIPTDIHQLLSKTKKNYCHVSHELLQGFELSAFQAQIANKHAFSISNCPLTKGWERQQTAYLHDTTVEESKVIHPSVDAI